MSNSSNPTVDRLYDLLADQALFGLEATEVAELYTLLEQHPDVREDEFELTAAALHAAHATTSVDAAEMPTDLASKLMAQADSYLQTGGDSGRTSSEMKHTNTVGSEAKTDKSNSSNVSTDKVATRESLGQRDSTREVVAWLFAAAALIIALFAWFDRLSSPADDSEGGLVPRVASLEEQRDALMADFDDATLVAWNTNDGSYNAEGVEVVEGDIVWSDSAQAGFMTIRGLAVDDPTSNSYQLWIFDEDRDQAHPVDGGIFHIEDSEQLTIIPIDAKLRVNEAVLFAITVEGPDGVVVSDRERLPLLADPAS